MEIFSLHYKAHNKHINTISSWREKKKRKRSLSKRKSTNCWVWSSTWVVPFFMRYTSSREWCSFPAQIFESRTSVFSHLFAPRDDTDPFLSLFNSLTNADVLLEQRDLFARIDQVRVCVFFFQKQNAANESFVDATVRHSFPDRRRIGLSLSSWWLRRKLTMNTSQLKSY